MRLRRRVFSQKNPYSDLDDNLFLEASRENFDYLIKNCEDYRLISEGLGIKSKEDIKAFSDIPVIPTMLFKQHDFKSGPYLVMATSSGTSGHYSKVRFEFGALWSALKMSIKITKFHGILSSMPCRYIVMGYKPHRSNKTAVTKTAYLTTFLAPAVSRDFILKYGPDGYKPDFEGIINALKKYEKGRLPIRFMGFPSYTFFLFQILEERGLSFRLPKGSRILLGGGWKQFYQEAADKDVFYKMAKKTLGIEEDSITEFFGAVEHPILYTDCSKHHFHVPTYSRVIIRNPDTLEPLPMGETGLVNLISPLTTATPILSVMTDDLGILHDGKKCGCGVTTPYLEIIGRVAPDNIKTCAAGASEMLKAVDV